MAILSVFFPFLLFLFHYRDSVQPLKTINTHQYLKFHAVLLEDVDVNWPINSQGDSALLLAIKQNRAQEVQSILESDCHVTATNKTLALELALDKLRRKSNLSLIRLLLVHGAQTSSPSILSKILGKIYHNSNLYQQLIQTICENTASYHVKGALLHAILQTSQCFFYPRYNGRCHNLRLTCENLFTSGTHPLAFWDSTFKEFEIVDSSYEWQISLDFPYEVHIPWFLIPTFIQAAIDHTTLNNLIKEITTNKELIHYNKGRLHTVFDMLLKSGVRPPRHVIDKLAVSNPYMHATYEHTQKHCRRLTDLCRISIRFQLKTSNAFEGLQNLEEFLPKQILNFLLLKDMTSIYFQE